MMKDPKSENDAFLEIYGALSIHAWKASSREVIWIIELGLLAWKKFFDGHAENRAGRKSFVTEH